MFSLKFKHYNISYLLKHTQFLHAILSTFQLIRAQSYQLAGHTYTFHFVPKHHDYLYLNT